MSISVDVHRKLESFQLDISFRSDSRRIGILGASGCGKSMTLKSIAGIETPDDGRIEIEGRVLFDKAEKVNLKPQKRNVGYLFQNYALFPTMSVEKNIAAGLREAGKRRRKRFVRWWKNSAWKDWRNGFRDISREGSSRGLPLPELWHMSRM